MKRHFYALLAAGIVAAPALYAQTTTAPATPSRQEALRPKHGGHGKMWQQLGLSADQQARVKAIHAKYEPQMKAARTTARPDMEAAKAARAHGDTAAFRAARARLHNEMAPTQQIRKQEMAEVRGILTPAQQQQLDTIRANHKHRDHAKLGRKATHHAAR